METIVGTDANGSPVVDDAPQPQPQPPPIESWRYFAWVELENGSHCMIGARTKNQLAATLTDVQPKYVFHLVKGKAVAAPRTRQAYTF